LRPGIPAEGGNLLWRFFPRRRLGGERVAEVDDVSEEPLRLAVSNIAWSPDEDDAVARVLRAHGVAGVELAPTKWRDDPFDAPRSAIAGLKREWNDRGFEVVSLQSLLFGHPALQLFGSDASRASLASFLCRVLDFAAGVGARAVVFGSPKNRVRGDLALDRAMDLARAFLLDIADHAAECGVAFCVEANPPGYGCDFVTTTAEAVALCRLVNHPAIRINGDLGGMTMSGEDPLHTIEMADGMIGHFHASEPQLAELGAGGASPGGSAHGNAIYEKSDHVRAARGLAAVRYDRWVSIEMRAASAEAGSGENLAAVERAVRLALSAYGSNPG
jgi:sugar phosphate isomerase/epimerase